MVSAHSVEKLAYGLLQMFGGQALFFAVEASNFGSCVRWVVSTMDKLGGDVVEVPWLIQALEKAVEMEYGSFGALAEVRSWVNTLWVASLSALVGPLGVFVPSARLVSLERNLSGLLGEMLKVMEFVRYSKEG